MGNMSFEEFQRYRDVWESGENRLMREDEVARFDSFFADKTESGQYQSEGFTRALAGDFSQYETVEPMLKGYLGAKKCYELYHRFQGNASDPQLQQEIKERLMEADLRAGFALGGKDPNDPVSAFMKECNRIANRQMLIQTLEEPEPTAKLRLLNQLKQEDPNTTLQKMNDALNKDLEQRVEIAKILFLNHLGKFQTYDAQQAVEKDENIAEVYTHGGRTMFILPAGADQKPVMNGIQGATPDLSGVQSRWFATHAVTPRTLRTDGSIAAEAKELSVKGLSTLSFSQHKGMNASVGGLGHVGPNGRMITADGTNGHMYMHLVKGKENVCGMMLVGFENAGPGKKGRLGHAHGASAKKAGGSAFLSDKSYLGNEFGGRVVDLSGLSGEKLAALLTQFESGYRNAAKAAQAGDSRLLDACNDLLTGKLMSVGQIKGLLQGLDVPKEQVDSVEPARAGHSGAAGYEAIAPEKNPPIPMAVEKQPETKTFRITEFPGLVRPEPPAVMKKPGLFDKMMYQLSFHSKNSYVSRYNEYQKTLPAQMNAYKESMQNYHRTLAALERGEGPKDLQAAYELAVQQAETTFRVPMAKTTVSQMQKKEVGAEVSPASPELAEKLENTFLDTLFQGLIPEKDSKETPEALRAEFREYLRQTSGYKKLIQSGDNNLSSILNSPEKMENVFKDVAKGILENMDQKPKPPSATATQKKQELVQKPDETISRTPIF